MRAFIYICCCIMSLDTYSMYSSVEYFLKGVPKEQFHLVQSKERFKLNDLETSSLKLNPPKYHELELIRPTNIPGNAPPDDVAAELSYAFQKTVFIVKYYH